MCPSRAEFAALDDLRAAHKAWREAVDRFESRFEHALCSGRRYDSSKGSEELAEIERLFVALKQKAATFPPCGEQADSVSLGRLLTNGAIRPVFQPIARLRDGAVHAHEPLIRGPEAMPLTSAPRLPRSGCGQALSGADKRQCARSVGHLTCTCTPRRRFPRVLRRRSA
jgi:hypothetical protein